LDGSVDDHAFGAIELVAAGHDDAVARLQASTDLDGPRLLVPVRIGRRTARMPSTT
jgi:hypothetical protein